MVTKVSDENLLWNIMRKIKEENNKETKKPDDIFMQNFRNLSKMLSINDVEETILNISDRDIQRGVEKFLYLNNDYEKTKHDWKKFYDSSMFYEIAGETRKRTATEILLSAIKPLKSFKSKDGQIIANKFILKLASELKFQYLKSNVSDETKVEWTRNEQDVKGE